MRNDYRMRERVNKGVFQTSKPVFQMNDYFRNISTIMMPNGVPTA
jgi:hypothetical protein